MKKTQKPPTVARKAARQSGRGTTGLSKDSRMALLSSLVGRANFISRMAGVQYGGLRDIFATAGYVAQGKVTFEHYWGLYRRGDIAGRIVDMAPRSTWRTPPAIKEADQTNEGTEFTQAFGAMADRLRLWQYFKRADTLAGIGRYAVMLIGVKGATAEQLKTPLISVPNGDAIAYIAVYDEQHAQIQEWETDPGHPRYGQPKLYKLDTSAESIGGTKSNSSLVVHASRLIHVAEDLLENEVFGRPRLERVLNRLYDLDKVAASTAEAYWQQVSRILQAKVDKDVEVSDTQLKAIDEKLGEMIHDLRRQFSGQGVELQWLDSKTPDVSQVGDFYFSLIAGASSIPKRILFGSEMGELASSQDQENWAGQINERQEHFAEPMVLRAFVDRLIGIKALPVPKQKKYLVEWPSLFEASDKEQAETSKIVADTAAALTPVGGNPLALVEIDEEGVVSLIQRAKDDPMPEYLEGALPDGDDDDEDDDQPEAGGGDGRSEPPPSGDGGIPGSGNPGE